VTFYKTLQSIMKVRIVRLCDIVHKVVSGSDMSSSGSSYLEDNNSFFRSYELCDNERLGLSLPVSMNWSRTSRFLSPGI
jgi:hypothetical protein